MTPRTCFLPNDLDGPGFYRMLFPMRELRNKGWDAIVPQHRFKEFRDSDIVDYKDRASLALPKKADYAHSMTIWDMGDVDADLWVLQRGQARGLRPRELRDFKDRRVIVENDDNSLHLPTWHRSRREYWANTKRANDEMHKAFRHADALTVSTPQLAEDYEHLNDNIHVIRNYLEWEMWADVEQQSEVERDRVRLGWMGAYDFRTGDLHQLRGVLGPWLERNRHVDFVVAGPNATHTHDLLGIPEEQRISIDGVDFSSGLLPEITATMDIGLVPLEPGRFNEGKSHLKGMEYAACGIPCIATPTESYRYWIEDGVNGLFATKPHEWRTAFETLVGDDALRRNLGRNARQKASHQTIDKHIHQWEAVYMAVGARHHTHDELQRTGAAC